MKIRYAAIACAGLLLGACDSRTGPKTYEEAMKAAAPAYEAGDMAKAFTLCQRALELADKAGSGFNAIFALECVAAASLRMGKPEKASPAYAKVIGTYGTDLSKFLSRLRLRNNYGVALYNAGKRADGIKVIKEAIEPFEASPNSPYPYFLFPQRMFLVANLAHAVRDNPQGEVATRLTGAIAQVIEAAIEQSGEGVDLVMNSAKALAAIAELERKRGQVARADALAQLAAERQVAEDQVIATRPRYGYTRECDHYGSRHPLSIESCFQLIP
jgi:tetratricopeptide (TPR) repeat protein